jgi:hypothetical protein
VSKSPEKVTSAFLSSRVVSKRATKTEEYDKEVLKGSPYPSYHLGVDVISPSWVDEEDLFTPIVSGVSYLGARGRGFTGLVRQTAMSYRRSPIARRRRLNKPTRIR